MNGVEWPAKSGYCLRFEANRNATQEHQALNKERLRFKNVATQTNPSLMESSTQTNNDVTNVESTSTLLESSTQTDDEVAVLELASSLGDLTIAEENFSCSSSILVVDDEMEQVASSSRSVADWCNLGSSSIAELS
jgi:hypothetical protein